MILNILPSPVIRAHLTVLAILAILALTRILLLFTRIIIRTNMIGRALILILVRLPPQLILFVFLVLLILVTPW